MDHSITNVDSSTVATYVHNMVLYIALCHFFILINGTSTQKTIYCTENDTVTTSISNRLVVRFFKYHKHYFYSRVWKLNFNKKSKIKIKRDAEYKARKAEIKCLEYSEKTAKVVWISKISPVPVRLKCHRPASPLIIGGEAMRPGEYPHLAVLGKALDEARTEYFCAGSLISERWILTAAHCCTHGASGPPTVVLLGSSKAHEINERNSGQQISITKIQLHPRYSPPQLYHDLALLELSRSVVFTDSIKPACLHFLLDPSLLPRRLWASGWGGSSDLSIILLHPIVPERCRRLYDKEALQLPRGIDAETQLCAESSKGDTCSGDSGAPLQMRHPLGCLSEVVAVTSFGLPCHAMIPGVYTKVAPYVSWIEEIAWPD